MDAIRAHIGRNLDLADDHGVFRQTGESTDVAVVIHDRRLRRHGDSWPNTTHRTSPGLRCAGLALLGLFENVLQHVDDLRRISALESDELAHHFRWRYVDLADDVHQAADHARVLGDENARGFRQR